MGSIIGALVYVLLNTSASLVPESLAQMSSAILAPAAANMINLIMPLLFLWQAMDAGKRIGIWSIILGGLMALISGNALPGVIFGILVGTLAEEQGYGAKATRNMFLVVFAMIALIGYFRGFHLQILDLF